MNQKHRPPHGIYKIREMIKLGQCDEAQRCTDENVEFYRDKIGDQQSLFLEAQCRKMGVKPTIANKTGAAAVVARQRAKPLGELLAEDDRSALLRRQAE